MKNNKFIKSTIILLIGGFITKILGMIIKIVMTRLIGTEGIGLYMLIMPTFMLLITLGQLGFPIAISKLVAEDKKNNKNLVLSLIPISLIINIIIIVLMLLLSTFISNSLLNEPRINKALICTSLVLPFISISSLLRSYFFGKQRMMPHVVSNVTEDIIRLITIIIGVPIFLRNGIESALVFIVLSNIVSELTSIFVLFIFLPKKFKISKKDIIPNKNNVKEVLNISIPSTGSRIIGSIGAFFEPIILTFILLKTGFNNNYIVTEYGILTGYVMPLLLLPSFFTLAISQALLPIVSKSYSNRNYRYTKSKIKQAIFISLLIGIPVTLFFEFFPELPLKLIYNTTEGVTYLRILAPIFLLYYIESPLISSMQGMGKAKDSMKTTFRSTIYKIIILTIGTYFFGMMGLVIAVSFNVIYVTIKNFKYVKFYLK